MQNHLQLLAATLMAVVSQWSNAQAQTANQSLDLKRNLQPFIKSYCMDCHGPDTQEGQVRFDRVAWQIDNNDTAQAVKPHVSRLSSSTDVHGWDGSMESAPERVGVRLRGICAAWRCYSPPPHARAGIRGGHPLMRSRSRSHEISGAAAPQFRLIVSGWNWSIS